jgi:hypothetical protein
MMLLKAEHLKCFQLTLMLIALLLAVVATIKHPLTTAAASLRRVFLPLTTAAASLRRVFLPLTTAAASLKVTIPLQTLIVDHV